MADDAALDAVLRAQHALLPAQGREFPVAIEVDHDVTAWHAAMVAAKHDGHLHDWPDHVAPLPTITTDDGFPTLDEVERQHIMRVYESTAGNKSKTAKILGMNRKTLYRKLTRYGVIAGDDAGA